MTHVHLAEADLVELALDPSAPQARRAEIASCAQCAAELGKLDAWLASVRGAAASDEVDDSALVRNVLSATTREDVGFRGDLRVIWGFARRRLQASVALRVAAALVAVHLAALPVLAWIVLRNPPPDRHFATRLVLPQEPIYPSDEVEPERTPSFDEPLAEPRMIEHDVAAPSNDAWSAGLRREEAQRLRALAIEPWTDRAPTDALARRLWERARQLRGAELDASARVLDSDADLNERALFAELWLDRWALDGGREPQLDRVLAELVADANVRSSALARCALQRAAALGALSVDQVAALGAVVDDRDAAHSHEAWLTALATLSDGASTELATAVRAWSATRAR